MLVGSDIEAVVQVVRMWAECWVAGIGTRRSVCIVEVRAEISVAAVGIAPVEAVVVHGDDGGAVAAAVLVPEGS